MNERVDELQQEIESLAAEIVHAYEELHLLYELGEVLTTDLTVGEVSDLLVEKILHALNAGDARLALGAMACAVSRGRPSSQHYPAQRRRDSRYAAARATRDGRAVFVG